MFRLHSNVGDFATKRSQGRIKGSSLVYHPHTRTDERYRTRINRSTIGSLFTRSISGRWSFPLLAKRSTWRRMGNHLLVNSCIRLFKSLSELFGASSPQCRNSTKLTKFSVREQSCPNLSILPPPIPPRPIATPNRPTNRNLHSPLRPSIRNSRLTRSLKTIETFHSQTARLGILSPLSDRVPKDSSLRRWISR